MTDIPSRRTLAEGVTVEEDPSGVGVFLRFTHDAAIRLLSVTVPSAGLIRLRP